MIGNDSLVRGLGATIRVSGSNGAVFRDGNHVLEASGVAIDGGRRREDDVGDIVTCHGTEKADGTVDVCAVVLQRNLAGFAYCLPLVNDKAFDLNGKWNFLEEVLNAYLQSSKVDHAVNIRMRLEDLVEVLLFPNVDIVELRSLARDKLNSINCLFGRVEQVVYNNNLVASLEEGKRCERPNVAATSKKS